MEINTTVVKKVLKTVDAGLSFGLGQPIPGKMCVEAAVCYALGLPHGDKPFCVSPVLRHLKIWLNDKKWTSNKTRAKGLRRLAVAQLGSSSLDTKEFLQKIKFLLFSKTIPNTLRQLSSIEKLENYKIKLINIAEICEKNPTAENNKKAKKIAADAADAVAYAADAATYAAYAATYAAYAAANAADAVAYAADATDAVAYAADAATYAAYAVDAGIRDNVLSEFAEDVVQILIEMNVPGCQYLYLCEGESK